LGEDKKLTLDIDQNSASLHITPDIYKRILDKAVSQTQQDIQNFEGALPVGDTETIKSVSHKLKGDYDNLRITDMALVAKQINEIAKTDFNKENIAELLNEFIHYFEQLKIIVERSTNE